ncbi:hypothetical protein OG612_42520 (plasmid) [Streptomyces sp. NBC_01527]|uniref:hypothetical protein n=1 Tax=unclassified Streptomyces TaxID=2593676 RepID=UPI002E160287|nr:hypothetical protein OG763_45685 [Streptomyces sp. NBC_01230]
MIEALGDVDMQQMHDDYAQAVLGLIEAKIEHHAPPKPSTPRREAEVADLMTALPRATEQARAERGQDAAVHPMTGRSPAKRTASKRTDGTKRAG